MFLGHGLHQPHTGTLFNVLSLSPEAEELDGPETEGGSDDSLEDAARKERDYTRERLRQELKREPTEEELNDWLRRHTEGY